MARSGLAAAARLARWADTALGPGNDSGTADGKATLSESTAERAAEELGLTVHQVRADWDTARLAGLVEVHGDSARPGWRLRAWDRDDSAVLRGWVALFDAWSLAHPEAPEHEPAAVAEVVSAMPQVLSFLQLSAGPVPMDQLLDLLEQRVTELRTERCEIPYGPQREPVEQPTSTGVEAPAAPASAPADSTAPAAPANSTGLAAPSDLAAPSGLAAPADSVAPADSTDLAAAENAPAPVGLAAPVNPAAPAGPAAPSGPAIPAALADSAAPAGSATSTGSAAATPADVSTDIQADASTGTGASTDTPADASTGTGTSAGTPADASTGTGTSTDTPLAPLLDWALHALASVGALTYGTGQATLTPLGSWAVWVKLEQICVAAQSPAGNIEVAAEEMLRGCAQLRPNAARAEYRAWLAARPVGSAVTELLGAARGDDALLRGLAFEAIRVVGAPAEPDVRSVADEPTLRPYALLWLAEHDGIDPEDAHEVLTREEATWLWVDTAAAVADHGEAPMLVRHLESAVQPTVPMLLDEVRAVGHPRTVQVLVALAAAHPDPALAKAVRRAAFQVHTGGN